ncbi:MULTISPECIES: hypothetical protein [Brevibacterium]|uniref:Uncharacterized protein n=2 Tax=Brevibacterium TaxID=1696 RepID=A0ABP9TYI3_9MICO
MTPMLLSPGNRPQPVSGIDDPLAAEAVGPALIVAADVAAALPESPDPTTLGLRPLSFRERGGHWQEIGYEAADHWQALAPALRARVLADRTAAFDVEEFKATTNGASASMITNNWIYSGHPRRYRIAGELRDLAEVVAAISA